MLLKYIIIQRKPLFQAGTTHVACYISCSKRDLLALKGDKAINFHVRNMPRLSVDIDLTYLPLESRNTALEKISEAIAQGYQYSERCSNQVLVSRLATLDLFYRRPSS